MGSPAVGDAEPVRSEDDAPMDPSAPDASADGPTPEPDVDQLVSERDALRREVEALTSTRRTGARRRSLVATALVVVFALTFAAAGVGIWLHRNTLNDDVWASRVAPLAEDPAVQEALAAWTTDQLMATVDPRALFAEALPDRAQILAVPLSSAVEGFVRQRVDTFFASDLFAELWSIAATNAHEEAVRQLRGERVNITAEGDTITINFVPMINGALAQITEVAPGLVGSDVELPTVTIEDVPEEAIEALNDALGTDLSDDFGTLTVFDGGKLSAAQLAVRIFDRFVILDTVVALAAAAGALWVSPRRRRTLLQLLGIAAVSLVLVRRIAFRLLEEVGGVVEEDVYRPAAEAVAGAFVDPLTRGAEIGLWIVGLGVAAAALTGPYPWAVSLRSRTATVARAAAGAVRDRATDDATGRWIVEHADALRVGGYVAGALALWFVDLSWLLLLLIAALVAGWQVLVARLSEPPLPAVEPTELGVPPP
jgi:hypothetical protein